MEDAHLRTGNLEARPLNACCNLLVDSSLEANIPMPSKEPRVAVLCGGDSAFERTDDSKLNATDHWIGKVRAMRSERFTVEFFIAVEHEHPIGPEIVEREITCVGKIVPPRVKVHLCSQTGCNRWRTIVGTSIEDDNLAGDGANRTKRPRNRFGTIAGDHRNTDRWNLAVHGEKR